MISTEGEFPYSIDYGRPSFNDDNSRAEWKKFFDLVETSTIPIAVNGIHYKIIEMIDNAQSYMGGGFKFCYFFKSKEDRKAFAKESENIEFKVEDFRNINFYTGRNKVLHLRFDVRYLAHVRNYIHTHNVIRPVSISPVEHVNHITNEIIRSDDQYLATASMQDLKDLKEHLRDCFFELD